MDVDPPPPMGTGSNLKRSSSAPMINVLGNTPTFREALSPLVLSIPRTRRFSASFSPNHSPSSPLAAVPSRVSQIKHEEGMDVMIRETAHEKEVQSKLQISQSWDDLSLADGCLGETSKRPRSLTDPLHIFTPPPGICNSPSPTRAGKQCFSPSMCASNKQAFSPSPSPSPTRKAFATRRSQSPITLRPSQFPVKRKFDMDMDQGDSLPMPSKRLNLSVVPQDMAVSHMLHHSLSQSSLEAMSSPEQTVPQDMGDSLSSSSGSPGCPSVFHHHHPSSSSGVRSPLAPVVSIDSPCNMEDS
ncbi:P2R1A-PPP2R2A-interacting phosphatase regulator 1 [Amblyomma americanum]